MNKKKVKAIPIDQWGDEEDDYMPSVRQGGSRTAPQGYYSKGKVWTVVVIILFIYFRFMV